MPRAPKLNDMIPVDTVVNGRVKRQTIKRRDAVLELVRQGVHQKVAAVRAGISEATFYAWRKRGMEARSGQYREFYDDLQAALSLSETTLVLQMRSHARTPGAPGVRATQFLLERRFPDRWGERKTVENVGAPTVAGPTTNLVLAVGGMTPEQLAALGGADLDDMEGMRLPTDDPAPPPAQEDP